MKLNLPLLFISVCFFGISQTQAKTEQTNFTSSSSSNPHSRIPTFFTFQDNDRPAIAEFTNFLNRNYQIGDFSFQLLQKETDNIGFVHYRYIQLFKGTPIKGTMLIAHTKNGLVQSFNGETTTEINAISEASISSESALNLAMKYVGAKTYKWQLADEEAYIKKEQNDQKATFYPTAEKFIVDAGKSNYRLAYRFDIYAQEPVSRKFVFIDAQTGAVISSEDRIHETEVTGSAVTAYAGTQSIKTDYTGTTYRLREASRGLGIETYNLQKGTTYTSAVDFTDADNIWNNVNTNKDQYATDAHFGAEKTYDFYLNKFNRNSIDNAGFKLISYVHYSSNYFNAFWDGTRMTYGDGNATNNPLTSMDIAGHEITHGLTEKTAALVYSYQSGALNESFSDIFGTAIEFYATPSLADWLIGEDIGTPFRSMSNPNLYTQPDTYLGTYWYTGTGDNGGVHYNSGVQNYWFYLLSMGGSGTNDIGNAFNVSGIGIDKAAAIAYRCLTTYLTSTAQYADARTYSIQSATDLYGACSPEVIATTAAWYAVGVGSNSLAANPTISFNGSSTFCSGSSLTLNANTLSNYQWNLNGQAIAGATNSSYVASTAGSYTLSTLLCGNTFTSSPLVITLITAAVSVSASATNSCQPVTLTANASAGYAIQWLKDDVVISGATSSTYTASTSGNYSARISSTIGPAVTLTNTTVASIPDNSCTGASSSITASGLPSSISSTGISIKINITHTWDGDLRLFLEAPNGDLLGLANAVGGSADNFTNTIFSDAGSAQIPTTGAPYTGTYKPWQTVFTTCTSTMTKTSFAGLGNGSINANGTWKLRAIDAVATDVGTINNWSITFPQTITPSIDCGPVTSAGIGITISNPINYFVDTDGDGIGSSITVSLCSVTAPAGYSSSTGDCNDNNANIQSPINYYVDADGDGVGSATFASLCSVTAPTGYSSSTGDCNDNIANIQSPINYFVDADGDGVGSASTASLCSVTAPAGYSSTTGDCNDNNASIQSPINYYVDADGDGVGSATIASLCSVTAPTGYSSSTGDCNDNNASIQSPFNYYVDADGDGVGSSTTASLCSVTAPAGYSSTTGDCNDNNANIQSPINYYVDADGDGVGSSTTASLCSVTAPAGYSSTTGDCNDNNASIQSPINYYVDADGDGVGSSTTASLCSTSAPAGYSSTTGDCNDNNANIQSPFNYYVDADGDGVGSSTTASLCSTSAPAGYSSTTGDCNDNNANIQSPINYYVDADGDGVGSSTTVSLCSVTAPAGYSSTTGDCSDNNASIQSPINYYVDADGDGVGSSTTASLCSTSAPAGYSSTTGDCNDNNASIQSPFNYYVDADGDGVGSSTTASLCSVTAPAGYSSTTGDCNDNNASIQSPINYYVDADGDGIGTSATASFCSATAPAGYSSVTGDCNDNNSAIKPSTTEICGNGIDDNCNGSTDEGCTAYTYYRDADSDGFGNASISITSFSASTPAGYSTLDTDCNDNNSAIKPSASEICGNGIDDNCNGTIDENGTALTAITSINGPVGVCKSQTGVVFSVSAISGATTYTWTVPTGATITAGQGSASVTVSFSATQAAGNICVKASNACVTTAQYCRSLTIYTVKPATPVAILGSNIEVCPGSTKTFSVAAVANTTTYTWTAPTNASVQSGQGTTTVTVSFSAAFVSGSMSVTAGNCIGTSTARTLTLYNKPATPTTITGATLGLCAGASGTYTCTAMTGATSYLWTVPVGWTINSGQGTTSVNITPAAYTSAAITVSAVSACGASTAKSLTIASTSATPGTITGTTTNVCSAGPYTYSIVAVTGATSYVWTVPTGCTILTNSGTSITMGTSSGFTAAGNVTVKSLNGCGSSVAKTLSISPIPTQPAVITGTAAVCKSQLGVTYSTTAVAGLTYVWTVPTGATIASGQGTNSIVVNFGTSVGSITVKASNGCALSTARSFTVTQLACRMADDETIETIQDPNFDIFPNPGHGTYTLRLNNIESSAKANIYSMTGQLIQQINIPVGIMEMPVNLNDAAEGIYLLRIESDTFVKELKVIKN